MSAISLPQRFLKPPQFDAPIDPEWLERGLVIACNPAVGAFNQVSSQHVTNSGGLTTTPTGSGKSWNGGASKYVDFGATYAPGSVGATVVQVVNPGTSVNVFSISSRAGSGSPGIEILIGNGGVAGLARARLDTVAITSDVTGLNDNRDHVLAVRYTPSTELKIWADHFGKSSGITSSIPASITPDQNLRLHSRGATYYTGKSGLFLYFDRPLPDADIATLLLNPYIIYQWLDWLWIPDPVVGGGFQAAWARNANTIITGTVR